MNTFYLTTKLTHIFRNIQKFTASNVICHISYREDGLPVISLPSDTHLFIDVYYCQLYRKYNIAYLTLS